MFEDRLSFAGHRKMTMICKVNTVVQLFNLAIAVALVPQVQTFTCVYLCAWVFKKHNIKPKNCNLCCDFNLSAVKD